MQEKDIQTEVGINLNWHSLELRRKISRLTIKHKIVNCKIAVDIPDCIALPSLITGSSDIMANVLLILAAIVILTSIIFLRAL